jgi:hypothetical protein
MVPLFKKLVGSAPKYLKRHSVVYYFASKINNMRKSKNSRKSGIPFGTSTKKLFELMNNSLEFIKIHITFMS